MPRVNKKLLTAAVAATFVYSPTSFAQALEEVIVTARKRAETMQDVPIAISAFSGEALEKAGVKELQNLNESVPNLEFSQGNVPQVFIRGIGQRDAGATVDPGVGVYVDGIYLARLDAQMLDTADVASVQVLRGPQGTLFGKNNVGGAMLMELTKPEEEFSGYIDLGVGNLNGREGKLMLNMPLLDNTLYSRVTLSSRTRDGFMQHVDTGDDAGDLDRMGVIAQLRWFASDESTLDILMAASKQSEQHFGFNCSAANNQAVLPFTFLTVPNFEPLQLEAACDRSRELLEQDKFDADGASAYQSENQLLGLTYALELDSGTLKSVTSFTRQDVLPGKEDNDGTALPVSGRIAGPEFGYDETYRRAKQYSQELQFSGLAFDETLDYTFGVFAQIEDLDERLYRPGGGEGLLALSGAVTGLPFAILLPNDTSFQFGAQDISKRNETYAAFAQASYALTDLLELTIGGRYTVEKRDLVNELRTISAQNASAILNQGVAAGQLVAAGPVYFSPTNQGMIDFYNSFIANGYPLDQLSQFEGNEEYREFTPMVSLKSSLPDNVLDALSLDLATAYFTYSSGFKSGGLEAATTGLVRFDPEKVANYELGIKVDALENRLRLNAALFYTDYEDIQIRNAQIFGEGDNVEIIIANAGKAKITGAELELTWQALDSLQVVAAAGWLQADLQAFDEVLRDDPTQVVDRSDEDFQEIPDKTFSVALVHSTDFDAGSLTSRLDAYYRDEVYVGIDDLSWDRREEATLPSYTLLNARIAWESADGRWQAALWGRNLSDKRTYDGRVGVLGLVGTTQLTPSLPRTYGLQLKLFF